MLGFSFRFNLQNIFVLYDIFLGKFFEHFGGVRKIFEKFGGVRKIFESFGGVRKIFEKFGGVRKILKKFGGVRKILRFSEKSSYPPAPIKNGRPLNSS